MIRTIPYSEIDFEKYDKCLATAEQRNFFAEKIILDQRCESWELLVLNDYQAIMPVPLKNKLGRNFVLMPLFVPQLGIFSQEDDKEANESFLKFLKRNYVVYQYHFNSKNRFTSSLPLRKNYKIQQIDYITLRKNYFKGRKSVLNKIGELKINNLVFQDIPSEFFDDYFKGLDKAGDRKAFKEFVHYLSDLNLIEFYGCFVGSVLLSLAFVIGERSQKHLLALVNAPNHLKQNAASCLIDYLLNRFSENFVFDFMGGNQAGIELFFKSFGAENLPYPVHSDAKISLVRKMIFFR